MATLEHAPITDGELARRIHAGAPESAGAEEAELCARFARRIRLYGLRHLGGEAAAADLVQRVLQITLEKLRAAQVRDPDRIGSFVLGTARMVARETAREKRREVPLEDGEEAATAPEEAPPGLSRERLSLCLQSLPERERTVVLLTFYQDRMAPEIAAAVGATEGNVRVIRHRAIRRLRACMGLTEEGA